MQPLRDISSHKEDIFTVHAGISPELIGQLVAYSTSDDPDLRAFTNDTKRFVTPEETQKWVQDSTRAIYTLTPEHNRTSLAGFGWLREDREIHVPDTVVNNDLFGVYQSAPADMKHTVAARVYGKYRGMKLATPFMEAAHAEYMAQIHADVALILADIHSQNIPSQKLFQRLGYKLLWPKWDRMLWLLDAKR